MVETRAEDRRGDAAAARHRRVGGAQGPHILLLDDFRTGETASRLNASRLARRHWRKVRLTAGEHSHRVGGRRLRFFPGPDPAAGGSVGCRVLAAEDGQAAWEMLDRHAGEVSWWPRMSRCRGWTGWR